MENVGPRERPGENPCYKACTDNFLMKKKAYIKLPQNNMPVSWILKKMNKV